MFSPVDPSRLSSRSRALSETSLQAPLYLRCAASPRSLARGRVGPTSEFRPGLVCLPPPPLGVTPGDTGRVPSIPSGTTHLNTLSTSKVLRVSGSGPWMSSTHPPTQKVQCRVRLLPSSPYLFRQSSPETVSPVVSFASSRVRESQTVYNDLR